MEPSKQIFLSASVPDPRRHPTYFETSDVVAIRDAIRALVTVTLPRARLVFGGHPAITPLVGLIAQDLNATDAAHCVVFQSSFYRQQPVDNERFERVVQVEETPGNEQRSLLEMRRRMLNEYEYDAGVFIGGMDGVEREFDMFTARHPSATLIPVASTGAAAAMLFNRSPSKYSDRLQSDLAFPSLFRDLLHFD